MLASALSAAELPFVVDPQVSQQSLAPALQVILDRDRALAIEAVRARPVDAKASEGDPSARFLGLLPHPLWVRMRLHNPGPVPIERLLVLRRGSQHPQQIWVGEGSVQPTWTLGGPAAEGGIDSRHAAVRLQLPAGAELPVVVRLDTRRPLVLDYALVNEAEFHASQWRQAWWFGGLFGLIVAMAAYVLALYRASAERLYLWFAGFSLALALQLMHFEGFAFAALWLDRHGWGVAAALTAVMLLCLCAVMFMRSFFDSPRRHPTADRWLGRPLAWLPWLPLLLLAVDAGLAQSAGGAIALITVLCLPGFGAVLVRGHDPLPASFLIALLAFFLSSAVQLLRQLGLLSELTALELLQPLLSGLAVLLFALAVSQRVRRLDQAAREATRRNEAQLAHLVEQRTAELSEQKQRAETALEQLQLAQAELVTAEKMASLGQLVAGVAHEINTPIGVANTAASFIDERCRELAGRLQSGQIKRSDLVAFTESAGESSRIVGKNLDRAAELVRNFKQVSVDRTSDGRRVFKLHDYLAALLDSLSPAWKRRPLKVSIDCPANITLDSFPGPLGQVVTNLVQNALLHAFEPEQSGQIRLLARPLDADRVELVVQDDGAGADAEVLRRMFDPFYTTRRNRGGTGLGLAIAFNIVTAKLGGSLTARSTPGQGMRFEMVIPRVAPEPQAS